MNSGDPVVLGMLNDSIPRVESTETNYKYPLPLPPEPHRLFDILTNVMLALLVSMAMGVLVWFIFN